MKTLIKPTETKFISTIIENSYSDNYWRAIGEWTILYDYIEEKGANCICGQNIKHCCLVWNSKTKKNLIIGNICINKFMKEIKDSSAKFLLRCYELKLINSWEYGFITSIDKTKKKLSIKQLVIFNRINSKILTYLNKQSQSPIKENPSY